MVDLLDAQEDGKRISPVLPAHVKNFLIDIDGTIGEDIPNEEPERMEDAGVYPMHRKSAISGTTKGM